MTAKPEDHDDFDFLVLEAMNTSFYIAVSNTHISNWKEIMTGWIRYVEKEWSRFNPNNELGLLNRLAPGETAKVSPPLFDVLYQAEQYREKTKGYFSPYLLAQMQYHGYTNSFPFQSSLKVGNEVPVICTDEHTPYDFNFETFTIKKRSENQIDLGGIGKGYAVEAAARWLKNIGGAKSGIVDGGGDITCWSDGKKEWKIGVAHPFEEKQEMANISLKNGSIATSNIVYRSWVQEKEIKHHLLNGKTGLPVESEILQATVITENCQDAEVMAKLCFMEKDSTLMEALAGINPHYSVLLAHEDETITTFKGR